MDFEQFFIFTHLILATVRLTLCEECIKIDTCSCKTSKGTVDLHKIPKSVLTITGGYYTYRFQPCEALADKCGDVTGKAAVCQRGTDSSYDLGDLSTVRFSGDPESNLQATYTSNDRISIFNIKCDRGTKGRLISVKEQPAKTFNFELHTLYACLGSSGGGDSKPSKKPSTKIGTGSVLLSPLILLFVILGGSLIAGILLLKFCRGGQDKKMAPISWPH